MLDDFNVTAKFSIARVGALDALDPKKSAANVGQKIPEHLLIGLAGVNVGFKVLGHIKGAAHRFPDEVQGIDTVVAVYKSAVQ